MTTIDGHAHIGPREVGAEYANMPYIYSGNELIRSMDENKVDKALVWAMRQSDDYRYANDYIAKAAKENSRLIPFARVNPWYETSAQWLENAIEKDGFKGIKLHPSDEAFDPDEGIVHPILEVAERNRVPVVFHSGLTARPAGIGMIADRFPKVKIILAHLGTELYTDCIFVAKKCSNVFLETSQCPFLPRIAKQLVQRVGAERVIWGSDVPYHFQAIEKQKLELAGLAPEELRLVIAQNVLRILSYTDT